MMSVNLQPGDRAALRHLGDRAAKFAATVRPRTNADYLEGYADGVEDVLRLMCGDARATRELQAIINGEA